ncbi:MAG: cyclic nucleotide-binding domain-containing protein [Mariprofundaceae bacterium]|nr:cyclic nucleotide-binding domain-containing protein [Mariprofundaceae bacterium]
MPIDIAWLEEKVFQEKIDPADARIIKKVTAVKSYKKGDTIINQGAAGGALYLLYKGSVSISCNQVLLASAGEAKLFGEISFLNGELTSATVTAESDCKIYMLTRNGYSELMRENQGMVFALFTYILKNTANVVRKMNADHSVLQHYITGGRA